MIEFTCKACGVGLKVSDDKAGKRGKCPKCRAPMLVPRLGQGGVPGSDRGGARDRGTTNTAIITNGLSPATTDAGGRPRPARAIGDVEPGTLTELLDRHLPLKGMYVHPRIPDKKLMNARRACNVPAADHILCLIDCTVLGSAKNCLLFGLKGVYFHNGNQKSGHAPYSTFPGHRFTNHWWKGIDLGNGLFVECAGKAPPEAVVNLLIDVGKLIGGTDISEVLGGPSASELAQMGDSDLLKKHGFHTTDAQAICERLRAIADKDLRVKVVANLLAMGQEAVPALVESLQDKDWLVRWGAGSALARMGKLARVVLTNRRLIVAELKREGTPRVSGLDYTLGLAEKKLARCYRRSFQEVTSLGESGEYGKIIEAFKTWLIPLDQSASYIEYVHYDKDMTDIGSRNGVDIPGIWLVENGRLGKQLVAAIEAQTGQKLKYRKPKWWQTKPEGWYLPEGT